jgi:hypothetical protein
LILVCHKYDCSGNRNEQTDYCQSLSHDVGTVSQRIGNREVL